MYWTLPVSHLSLGIESSTDLWIFGRFHPALYGRQDLLIVLHSEMDDT